MNEEFVRRLIEEAVLQERHRLADILRKTEPEVTQHGRSQMYTLDFKATMEKVAKEIEGEQ